MKKKQEWIKKVIRIINMMKWKEVLEQAFI